MAEPLRGRTALVSGGARGIGAAIGRELAARGASVVIGDALTEEADALAGEIGPQSHAARLDVTRAEDWTAAVAEAERRFGPVTILVNNAGIFRTGAVGDVALAEFRTMLEVNLVGALAGIQAVLAGMRAAGGGAIVNLGSAASTTGYAGLAAYVASKHALLGLTKAAALDLAGDNIRVNAILPGQVRTPMTEGWPDAPRLTPLGRPGEPEEVARLASFLVSDDSSYCTGTAFPIDGGLTAGLSNAVPRAR